MSDVNEKIEELVKFANVGFKFSAESIKEFHKEACESIQRSDIANYKGHTGAGKARYVASMVEQMGSQQAVATHLKITKGRVSQLVKRAKENGK